MSPHIQNRVNHIATAVSHYFEAGEITDGSATMCLKMWKTALLIAKDNMPLGTGTKSYLHKTSMLIKDGHISPKVGEFKGPHNQYLSHIVEYELLGLISLMGIYISAIMYFIAFKKAKSPLAICGIIIVLGYKDFNLVGDLWSVNTGGVFFVAMLASISALLVNAKKTMVT